jgi:hypothetical protein
MLRKNSESDRKAIPQGLKPDVFSVAYGTTEQGAEKLEIGRKAYLRG